MLSCDSGDHLFHEGAEYRGVYTLISGLAALERVSPDGQVVVIRTIQPDDLFGCADLFGPGWHRTSARALTPVRACFVPAGHFRGALSSDWRLSQSLLEYAMMRNQETEERIFSLCTNDVPGKVLELLRHLGTGVAPDEGGRIVFRLPLRRKDLAAMVGTSPEVLSRALRRLERDGAAWLDGDSVSIAASCH